MSWWTERKARKERERRMAKDPKLVLLYEQHAATTYIHLHADKGIIENTSGTITWHLDGGTTVFIPRDEWYEIMERLHNAYNAGPDYIDVGAALQRS
jgi:hypothetical protein